MSERAFIQGRFEAPDTIAAEAFARDMGAGVAASDRVVTVLIDDYVSYRFFEELFLAARELLSGARLGALRGQMVDDYWTTALAAGDGTLSHGAQRIANLAYALDWEGLEELAATESVARELHVVYPTFPDAQSKALLIKPLAPHLGDAPFEVVQDVLELHIPSGADDAIAIAKSIVLAHLDGDPDTHDEYFALPPDELERVARARARARGV